jgi:NADH-quinone oxidoreductase subunit G
MGEASSMRTEPKPPSRRTAQRNAEARSGKMTDDKINMEVDGRAVVARPGQMIIEVTDTADIYVPRFCYHEKLSIAANCRMCLVEVENVPKPLPACATPVAEGMKVLTRSALAKSAQQATMEFLLINHPLDCPICDQGGECELQDLALGYGNDVSRYTEKKRVVKDSDLGALVSTDMTRCIYCTRCVRFGEEIAGIQELGTIGRGENTEIGTFVEKSVDHELSGNIIDLCPVGALNSKPFRYQARSWEMTQSETIAPHDCVGSNLYAHVRRGRLMRVVPRDNENVNETWISDRDRFSYEGVYAQDRLHRPMLKKDGEWVASDWASVLQIVAEGIRSAAAEDDGRQTGFIASPSATLEELYLLNRISRGLGSNNIDHRLRRVDFSDQQNDPLIPGIGMPLAELEALDALLVIGSDLRHEAPMLAHRVRKAAINGAKISFLNPSEFDLLFDVAENMVIAPSRMTSTLEDLVALASGKAPKKTATDSLAVMAQILAKADKCAIMLGHLAGCHPDFGRIRSLAAQLAGITGAGLGYITEGANSAGGALAGALPHRGVAGTPVESSGRTAQEMLSTPLGACVLLGIEPEYDTRTGVASIAMLEQTPLVVSMTSFVTDTMKSYADVLLPIGTFAETAGTYVNCEGRWQSFEGIATPVGEARPGWKVLRVLGNLLGLEGFAYETASDVRQEVSSLTEKMESGKEFDRSEIVSQDHDNPALVEVPMHAVDPLVRRSAALQSTRDGRAPWRHFWS